MRRSQPAIIDTGILRRLTRFLSLLFCIFAAVLLNFVLLLVGFPVPPLQPPQRPCRLHIDGVYCVTAIVAAARVSLVGLRACEKKAVATMAAQGSGCTRAAAAAVEAWHRAAWTARQVAATQLLWAWACASCAAAS